MEFDPWTVVLTAAAVVIFWRLKSVLGQRTGLERPASLPLKKPVLQSPNNDLHAEPVSKQPVWAGFAEENTDLAKTLEKIATRDTEFTMPAFMAGAKAAYELIHTSFAKNDKETLSALLTKPVLESFSSVIAEHKAQGETKSFQFVGMNSAMPTGASLAGNRANIDVLFNSEMIMATLNNTGTILSGDTKKIIQMSETWSFERDLNSKDPNWRLSATADAPE